MLLQHIAAQLVPHRPVEDHLGSVREMSLAVRIIRLVHQYTRPENVDHRLGHGGTFEGLGATTEAAHLNVLDRLVLERMASRPARAACRCPTSAASRSRPSKVCHRTRATLQRAWDYA